MTTCEKLIDYLAEAHALATEHHASQEEAYHCSQADEILTLLRLPGKPTVAEILRQYLKMHGYDGLCCQGGDGCGCGMNDFIPCQDAIDNCAPAYRADPPEDNEYDAGPGDDWYTTEKST